MSQRYFQMDVSGAKAEIVIFGDITSWPWDESDVSSYGLARQLAELGDVSEIDVRINSYGGEVAEGVAIYNALKNHPAKVTTRCEGFACSIASVIFMAGDERVMNEASLLMIHNAWSVMSGNAEEHRKEADDLDTVTGLSKQIYLAATDLSEEELDAWMDAETFIDAETALERGFATDVIPIDPEKASQGAALCVAKMLTRKTATMTIDEDVIGRMLYESLSAKYGEPPEEPPEDVPEEADETLERVRMAGAYIALS